MILEFKKIKPCFLKRGPCSSTYFRTISAFFGRTWQHDGDRKYPPPPKNPFHQKTEPSSPMYGSGGEASLRNRDEGWLLCISFSKVFCHCLWKIHRFEIPIRERTFRRGVGWGAGWGYKGEGHHENLPYNEESTHTLCLVKNGNGDYLFFLSGTV